jgi:recombinational DNA repair protein RecR
MDEMAGQLDSIEKIKPGTRQMKSLTQRTDKRKKNEIIQLNEQKNIKNYDEGESGSEFMVRFRDLKPQ